MAIELVRLRNGVQVPLIGLGTYKASAGESMQTVVNNAIAAGYRSIDTAEHYGNEAEVGAAVLGCGIPRKEIFLTTKIWNEYHGYRRALEAFDRSEAALGTWVDMLLIHWPCPMAGLYRETWCALQELYRAGRVQAIGVSNFKIHHLEELRKLGGDQPMVNQIEMHPRFIDHSLLDYCRENGILVEAWSPLLRGAGVTTDPVVREIAQRCEKSPVQIVLRYLVQLGARVLVKSSMRAHTEENAQIFDFSLSGADMERIAALNTGERFFQDPDEYYL